MKRSINMLSISLLPALMLAASGVMAAPPDGPLKAMSPDNAMTGEQLKNAGDESKLHQRLNENNPENAKKVRAEKQTQQGKKSKNQYRYEEKGPGQHMHQSGSHMGGGGGGGRR
jgi:hypothetical protein